MTSGSIPSSWTGAHPSPLLVVNVSVVVVIPFVLLNIDDVSAGDTAAGDDVFVVATVETVCLVLEFSDMSSSCPGSLQL